MTTTTRRACTFGRIACMALAAILLAGCVVVPAPGYYRWHPGRYYY